MQRGLIKNYCNLYKEDIVKDFSDAVVLCHGKFKEKLMKKCKKQ